MAKLNITLLQSSAFGNKTEIALAKLAQKLEASGQDVTTLNLKQLELEFCDGRNFTEYEGDTKKVIDTIMATDVLFIGFPVFQGSIPGTLKNIFDLLPQNALEYKTVGCIVTAGSKRHYLVCEQQLLPILRYMRANVVSRYVFITDTDFTGQELTSDDIDFRLDRLLEDTLVLAETYQHIWQKQENSYGF